MTETSAYNVGIDIERAGRFESVADDQSLRALFTAEERRYCAGSGDAAASYAGTWCAKEAIVKALAPWVVLDPRRVTVARTAGEAQVLVSGWSGSLRRRDGPGDDLGSTSARDCLRRRVRSGRRRPEHMRP